MPLSNTETPWILPGSGPYLIIGGAYTGKSQWLMDEIPPQLKVLLLGTADPTEPAFAFRLKQLKEARPSNWTTLDTVERLVGDTLQHGRHHDLVVIDSMNQWLAAEMLRLAPGLTVETLYHRIRDTYKRFTDEVLGSPAIAPKLILVSSEVSYGIAPQDPTARIFRQSVAEMNLHLARLCPKVLKIEVGIARSLR